MNLADTPRAPILAKPKFRLKDPDKSLTADEFELLVITSEDLRYLAMLVGNDFIDSAPDVRAMSTMLRRLLCEGDLHKAAKLACWTEDFYVRTRVLSYDVPHPQVTVSCGGGKWGQDRLGGGAATFGGNGIAAPPESGRLQKTSN